MAEFISGVYRMLEDYDESAIAAVAYDREITWLMSDTNGAFRMKDSSGVIHYIYEYTAFNDLSDVEVGAIASGQLVIFDGDNFVPIDQSALSAGELTKYQDGYALKDANKAYKVTGSGGIDLSFTNSGILLDTITKAGAVGANSFAVGYNTLASGIVSYAEGSNTKVYSWAGHVEGDNNEAGREIQYWNPYKNGGAGVDTMQIFPATHAEGQHNLAYLSMAHVEGQGNIGGAYIPEYTLAGEEITRDNITSEMQRMFNIVYNADGYDSVINFEWYDILDGIFDLNDYMVISGPVGVATHTEGAENINLGTYGHAEGYRNKVGPYAPNSHVEGYHNKVYSESSHAEGHGNSISLSSASSHAEGNFNTIGGIITDGGARGATSAHIEGYGNKIFDGASNSHVEGSENKNYSHSAHVEGYNNEIMDHSSFAHIEGYKNVTASSSVGSHNEGYNNLQTKSHAHVEGDSNAVYGHAGHAEGNGNIAGTAKKVGSEYDSEGNMLKYDWTGTPSITDSRVVHYDSITGFTAHVEGNVNIASASKSHAEGENNIAGPVERRVETSGHYNEYGSRRDYVWIEGIGGYGENSHVEGNSVQTFAEAAHAEGIGTIAGNPTLEFESALSGVLLVKDEYEVTDLPLKGLDFFLPEYRMSKGMAAHAEGIHTQALGSASHATGYKTVASGFASFVGGKNNISEWPNTFVHGASNTLGYADIMSYYNSSGVLVHPSLDPDIWAYDLGSESSIIGAYNYNYGTTCTVEGFSNISSPIVPKYVDASGTLLSKSNYIQVLSDRYPLASVDWSNFIKFDENDNIINFLYGDKVYGNGGETSHIEGARNIVNGNTTHVEGTNNGVQYGANGCHVEGHYNHVNGPNNHVEGIYNILGPTYGTNVSHVEGSRNHVVAGNTMHVEGEENKVDMNHGILHIEGYQNQTWVDDWESVGNWAFGSSSNSHIQGTRNQTKGLKNSLVGGSKNKVRAEDSIVHGRDNTVKVGAGSFIIGSDNITKKWDVVSNYVKQFPITDMFSSIVGGYQNVLWSNINSCMVMGNYNIMYGSTDNAVIFGANNKLYSSFAFIANNNNKAKGLANAVFGDNNVTGLALRKQSFTSDNEHIDYHLGEDYITFGYAASAIGMNNTVATSASHSEGNNNVIGDLEQRTQTVYTDTGSFIETYDWLKYNVYDTTLVESGSFFFGESSHAEGSYNKALAHATHVEGIGNIAGTSIYDNTYSGVLSGYIPSNYMSKGVAAHAGGIQTQALGTASYTAGIGTVANLAGMTALGLYNNPKVDSILEVGIGSAGARANGLRVDNTGLVYADNASNLMISGAIGNVLVTKNYLETYGGGSGGDSLWVQTSTELKPITDPRHVTIGDPLDPAGKLDIAIDVAINGDITVSGTEDGTGPGGVGNADGVYTYIGGTLGQMDSVYQRGTDQVWIGRVTAIWIITWNNNPGFWTDGEYFLNSISPIGTYNPIGGSQNTSNPVTTPGGSAGNPLAIFTNGEIESSTQISSKAFYVKHGSYIGGIGITNSPGSGTFGFDINTSTSTDPYVFRRLAVDYLTITASGTIQANACAIDDISDPKDLITLEYYNTASPSGITLQSVTDNDNKTSNDIVAGGPNGIIFDSGLIGSEGNRIWGGGGTPMLFYTGTQDTSYSWYRNNGTSDVEILSIGADGVVTAPQAEISEISYDKDLTTKEYVDFHITRSGPSASRPSGAATGTPYFNTDLGYPIWFDGTNWVNATGAYVLPAL